MDRESIYQRLRDIGCSCETADPVAQFMSVVSDKKMIAIFEWLLGRSQHDAARVAGIGHSTLERTIVKMREACR